MSSSHGGLHQKKVKGTGAELSIPLGGPAKRVEIYNVASNTSLVKDETDLGKFAKTYAAAGAQAYVDNVAEFQGDKLVIDASAAVNVADEELHVSYWEKRSE